MAQELANNLHFDEVRFIPSANPPHKPLPLVSAEHRSSMVQLAISDNPLFVCDTQELTREGTSYTIDTVIALRKDLGDVVSICLIMGSDAFMQLNTWYRWQELLNYCHIILVQRPNNSAEQTKLPIVLEAFLQENYTEDAKDLSLKKAGYIHMQKITAHEISSTAIREAYKLNQTPYYLVPLNVIQYIAANNLYI